MLGIRHRLFYERAKSGHWETTTSKGKVHRLHFGVTSEIDGDLIAYDLVIGKHRWVYIRDWEPNSTRKGGDGR